MENGKEEFIIKTTVTENVKGSEKIIFKGESSISDRNIELDSVEKVVLFSALNRIKGTKDFWSNWNDSWNDGSRHVQSWGRGSYPIPEGNIHPGSINDINGPLTNG